LRRLLSCQWSTPIMHRSWHLTSLLLFYAAISSASAGQGPLEVVQSDQADNFIFRTPVNHDSPGPLYYTHFWPPFAVFGTPCAEQGQRQYALATAVHISSGSVVTSSMLNDIIAGYVESDDVWNDAFLDSLIINFDPAESAAEKLNLDDSVLSWIREKEISCVYVSGATSPNDTHTVPAAVRDQPLIRVPAQIAPGPYLIQASTGSLHNVYRLYKDTSHSFLFGTIQTPDGAWSATNITFSTDRDDVDSVQFIPVPSRLPASLHSEPLAAMRFGLKDIFDVEGLPTGAGSLAYAKLHPSAPSTASSVNKLFSLGARMVGKTRTSQFAHGANPWEFVDIPYSWNPRGDGYLTASASSSGSACAIATYDWLDFTVGSDTRGSVRKPASLVGAYGIRPSVGSLDLTGVVPLSDKMDTAGFFARDPALFTKIIQLW
jgi:hypothetical protein